MEPPSKVSATSSQAFVGLIRLDPGYNPASEAFKTFDQDQISNPLGSLHLDTEEEPRRGASRANSVRFDESALHGHFGHNSRSSSEFFPLRIGNGTGGHPMTERSSSHKSDGRQSSLGVSAHSTRLNSLAFDSRPVLEDSSSVGPPPGLSFLGPLPAIIRCWLDTNFSNESLLYAAICTGSYRSVLSSHIAIKLGLAERIIQRSGESRLKLQVYLPEATVQHPSTRPVSPASQLPAITIEFEVHDISTAENGIQIFLGSDLLRAKSADILFSQERMTVLDDDCNKLAVPLVRPERLAIFRDLVTLSIPKSASYSILTGQEPIANNHSASLPGRQTVHDNLRIGSFADKLGRTTKVDRSENNTISPIAPPIKQQSVIGDTFISNPTSQQIQGSPSTESKDAAEQLAGRENGTQLDTPSRTSHGNVWGSWRRDSAQSPRQDSTFSSIASSSGYQKPSRGKGMKVLKPTRASTFRSASVVQTPTSLDMTHRWQEDVNQHSSSTSTNAVLDTKSTDSPRASISSDSKTALMSGGSGSKARPTNPVGGASAFGWLNSSQRQTSTSIE